MKKTIFYFCLAAVMFHATACNLKLLKNASEQEAFEHAKTKNPGYVADEGNKLKESNLEQEWPPVNKHVQGTIG